MRSLRVMAEETKTYTGVTREKIDRLRSAIGAFVKLPESDSGSIEGSGVSGSYAYDEAAQSLTLTVAEAPPFIPRAMIWSNIERALER